MKNAYVNLPQAISRLSREAPTIADHHIRNHPVPVQRGGMPLFLFVYEDTCEVNTRDDGVSWSTDGTRSWEIVQMLQNGGSRVVEGYYCYDRGGVGI